MRGPVAETARILLATSNPHKLDEVRAVLSPARLWSVIGLDDVPGAFEEPVEDADTFEGNARIKAVDYARMTGVRCLADDSGLVVDALDGAPGVHSARYSGVGSNRAERDEANNTKLLASGEAFRRNVVQPDSSAACVWPIPTARCWPKPKVISKG